MGSTRSCPPTTRTIAPGPSATLRVRQGVHGGGQCIERGSFTWGEVGVGDTEGAGRRAQRSGILHGSGA